MKRISIAAVLFLSYILNILYVLCVVGVMLLQKDLKLAQGAPIEVAEKFRKYVLTPGGIDDAMDMYINFRGKQPNTDPLLKNRGLK